MRRRKLNPQLLADIQMLHAYERLKKQISDEEAHFAAILACNQDALFEEEFDRHNQQMAMYMGLKKELEEKMAGKQFNASYINFLKREIAR